MLIKCLGPDGGNFSFKFKYFNPPKNVQYPGDPLEVKEDV